MEGGVNVHNMIYSTIVVKGPGTGTVWDGYFRYFPFMLVARTEEEHKLLTNVLDQRFLQYTVTLHRVQDGTSSTEKQRKKEIVENKQKTSVEQEDTVVVTLKEESPVTLKDKLQKDEPIQTKQSTVQRRRNVAKIASMKQESEERSGE